MTASVDSPRLDPAQLRLLLTVLCGALALVVAGNSALAIALPDIAADVGADQGQLTWIIDAYALSFAALLLPAGIAADRIGRRTLLVAGLLVFGAAGVASAYASDPAVLIGLRALAGVGAAGVFPVTLSALVDAYPPERRAFAVAVWSAVSAAGAVGGTIVAGVLLQGFWWGSVQLVFGVAALLLAVPSVRLVAQHRTPGLSLDPWGGLLALLALTGLVYGIIAAPDQGWTDPLTLVALGLGGLALVAFCAHELTTAQPSLDVRLFRSRGLATGSVLVSVQFFASLGLFVLAPQYLQIVRSLSPLQAALALLVIPVGVGAGTALAPRLIDGHGARFPGAAGLAGMAVGFAVLALGLAGGVGAAWWPLALGLLVFGFGFGLGVTPGTVLILEGLPPQRRSVASAVNDITREVGGVLGIAVLSSVLIARYRDVVADAASRLPATLRESVADSAGAGLGIAAESGPGGSVLADGVRLAFAEGMASAMWVGAAVLGAAGIGCALLGPRGRSEPEAQMEPEVTDVR